MGKVLMKYFMFRTALSFLTWPIHFWTGQHYPGFTHAACEPSTSVTCDAAFMPVWASGMLLFLQAQRVTM